MALIDDLRPVADKLDSSLQPTSNELAPLLGALLAYVEHGPAVLKAAEGDDGAEGLSRLLSSTPDDASSETASSESEKDKDSSETEKDKDKSSSGHGGHRGSK